MQLSKKSANKTVIFLVLLALPILLMLFELQTLLRYQSIGTIEQEYWRWLTGHWVHLSWGHLWMNWLALLIIFVSFNDLYSARDWLMLALSMPLLISLQFIFFAEQLVWYVGLSGWLHGLIMICMLQDAKLPKAVRVIFIILLTIKLLWEQVYGALPGSAELAGGNVVVDAHLFGAISGVLVHIAYVLVKQIRKRLDAPN